jgi:LuxR family maltose regulon positive regulatory protein
MMVGLGIPEVFCARAMLVIGNASGAERLCKRIDHLPAVCQEARITRLIIEALARERLYGKGTGVSLMREALEKAQPDGVLLPFAETLDVRTLLRVKGIVGDAGETFLSQVRQACDVYAQTSYRQSQSSSAVLSQRELEILRLAARGMTRAQIANEACIKEDTVKKHLSAAYRKLGASNRTEALRTARIEGLL